MYLEFPTQIEARNRSKQAASELGYGKHTLYAGLISQTNSDTFVWKVKGTLTEDEQANLIETFEPKAWEDLI
jgi:hypothetical protein